MVVVLIFITLSGCGNSQKSKLNLGMDYAEAQLQEIGNNYIAAVSYQSTVETGGSVINYLLTSIMNPEDHPRYELNRATKPWTVVIRYGSAAGEFIIEGYGEDLNNPIANKKVRITILEAPK